MAAVGRLLQISNITAHPARQTEQTRFGRELLEYISQGQSGVFHDQRQTKRIEIANTFVLWQTSLRTHAHGGGDTLASSNCAQATRTTEMQRNDACVLTTEQFRS